MKEEILEFASTFSLIDKMSDWWSRGLVCMFSEDRQDTTKRITQYWGGMVPALGSIDLLVDEIKVNMREGIHPPPGVVGYPMKCLNEIISRFDYGVISLYFKDSGPRAGQLLHYWGGPSAALGSCRIARARLMHDIFEKAEDGRDG